jgi:protein-disulfide isomerase
MSMPSLRIVLAALVAVFVTTGCNKQATPAASATNTAAANTQCEMPAETVIASYKSDGAEKKVTYGELREKLAPQFDDLEKRKQELIKRGLEGYVLEQVVEAEAKKRGLANADAFIKAEIEDKVPAPPEAEISKIFEQAKSSGQLPAEVTLEQVKPEIIKMLTDGPRREKAQALFTELKAKADIQTMLPVKRTEVAATGPGKGPEGAPITIVEFSDFQCPFCSKALASVDEVMKAYDGKVRLVFRHFPLEFHKQAPKAAEASMCAADQNKFWEMHDKLFANQQALMPDDLKKHAAELGLDAARFNECLDSGKHAATVTKDFEEGKKAGVTGTPAFFINGIALSGALPPEEFKSIIDAELKKKK